MTSDGPERRTDRALVVVDLPRETAAAGTAFWATALGWPDGGPVPDHPEFVRFVPPGATAYVSRQLVGGPPGVHLDLEVDDLDRSAERLIGLGAGEVRTTDQCHTLVSPGGLGFCLRRATPPPSRPSAVTWPTGHRSRLVQVSIDSPPDHHEREVAFWRAATGWRWAAGNSPEFAGKLYPAPGSFLQLLLHRLGEDDGGQSVRAHLDLGTDGVEREAERLVDAGATRLWDGPGWITLRDPAGMLFCVTRNSPDAP